MLKPGAVRIIGGRWRGRRLAFPEVPGLRPSPDRVRETLFNWLSAHLPGSRCLDLYAGSGALGFEALSRGAAQLTLVESHPTVVAALNSSMEQLGAKEAQVVQTDASVFLRSLEGQPYDILFIDPPFNEGLVAPCLTAASPHIARWMYVESEAVVASPAGWEAYRTGQAGHVYYHLFKRI